MSSEESEIIRRGIAMVANNDLDACEKHFAENKDSSLLLSLAYDIIFGARAILSTEDQYIDKAIKHFKATEKKCKEPVKLFSSLKKAFDKKSSQNANALSSQEEKEKLLEEKLSKAIILADCKFNLVMLDLYKQDYSHVLSHGLLQLKKAWKLYAKIHKKLFAMYKRLEPNAELIYGMDATALASETASIHSEDNELPTSAMAATHIAADDDDDDEVGVDLDEDEKSTSSGAGASGSSSATLLPLETCKRLLGAVSLGYGLFQFVLSFIPPNILQFIKLFGFQGDRASGVKAILFASKSKDLRSFQAELVLLWYGTILAPMFALDESESHMAHSEVRTILERCLAKHPTSAIYQFFNGKHMQSLLSDWPGALDAMQKSVAHARTFKDFQAFPVYEVGMLYLERLDYEHAIQEFELISHGSKLFSAYCSYMCALCSGCLGEFNRSSNYLVEMNKQLKALDRKCNTSEHMAVQRQAYFKGKAKAVYEFFVTELLYYCMCLPLCDEKTLERMLTICDQVQEKELTGVKTLIKGYIHVLLQRSSEAEQLLKECIAVGESEKKEKEKEKLSFGDYYVPSAQYELAALYESEKKYAQAKVLVKKALDHKEYELENQLQMQLKMLHKRIKLSC